jgi:CubicO group peptidase (beta-lactamase class C family)
VRSEEGGRISQGFYYNNATIQLYNFYNFTTCLKSPFVSLITYTMKLKFTLALLLLVQIAFGQDRIHKIDSLLNSLYTDGTFNGNVLIAEKGTIIYQHSFGIANELTKEKLNENSIFELASCTKQFTAMGIMILKEQGKLNLDDLISKFIPEFGVYKNVTIRNLLNHTGGLPDYIEIVNRVFDKSKIATNKDIIALLPKYQPNVLFEPNSKFEYSNTGYAILASIIEKISGKTYADFLAEHIFKPLKMDNTFVYRRRFAPKNIKNYAFGYVYSDSLKKYVLPDEIGKFKFVVWLDGIVGDGSVNSTVIDLLKWDRALYTDQLISKEAMKEVYTAATLTDGSKSLYGFGWFFDTKYTEFGKLVFHGGGWPGYATFIVRNISNDQTIIILQNRVSIISPVNNLMDLFYNKPLATPVVKKEITLTNDQLQKLVGRYEIAPGFDLKISLENNQLLAQLSDQPPYPLFAESELVFFPKITDAKVEFEKDSNGEITQLVIIQGGNKMTAIRKKE